jgi:hypothetical protein
MKRFGRWWPWLAGVTLALPLACDLNEPGEAQPVVLFHTRFSDDGSVAFSVTTPEPARVDSVVAACEGCRALLVHSPDGTANVLVVGPLANGPIARLVMANGVPASWYSVKLVAVARRDYLPRTLPGYGLSVQ